MKWSFGKSVEEKELRFGYEMRFTRPIGVKTETNIDWVYVGTPCHGKFIASGHCCAVLNFFLRSSVIVVTYRYHTLAPTEFLLFIIIQFQPPK